ncbi:hypothetical protein MKZ38_006008 [Zalerion maritima]|uniref:Uncharacterized protein n=1 Tax=Zalerion maritima TaxID=339359 RepID=A0AAD5RJD6_9PEZI|nr:hypothetical protein MKZ38_006008 [Zalerion maritima]
MSITRGLGEARNLRRLSIGKSGSKVCDKCPRTNGYTVALQDIGALDARGRDREPLEQLWGCFDKNFVSIVANVGDIEGLYLYDMSHKRAHNLITTRNRSKSKLFGRGDYAWAVGLIMDMIPDAEAADIHKLQGWGRGRCIRTPAKEGRVS